MVSSPHDPAKQLALEITRYLDAHPDAADTIDGVIQWWLQPLGAGVSGETVQRALDELAIGARIVRRVSMDGAIIYARH